MEGGKGTINDVSDFNIKQGILKLTQDIAKGVFNGDKDYKEHLTQARGIPLAKNSNRNDPRPIAIGQLFTSIASALVLKHKNTLYRVKEIIGPTDLGHGTKGGV